MLRRLWIGIVIFQATTFGGPLKPVVQTEVEKKAAGIVDRGVVVPRSSFNLDQVRRMATDFLQNEAKGASIARLMIGPNALAVDQNYGHGAPHNNTYQSTVEGIKHNGFPSGPVARVLSVGGRAKISYWEGGQLTEDVLSGTSDPTVLHEGRYAYEILHFILNYPLHQTILDRNVFVTIYLKASPTVSAASCARLYAIIRKLTTAGDLLIHIRTDPWFMEEMHYPAVLVFTKPLVVPNSVHYLIGSSITCGTMDNHINCSGLNFSP